MHLSISRKPVFISEDESVAVVDEAGKVTALAEGEVKIEVSAPETRYYYAYSPMGFPITVRNEDDIQFTEPPYFNNDNNPYDEDFTLHYRAINVSDCLLRWKDSESKCEIIYCT